MNLKRIVPISLIALLLSMILPIANAEQLKRYKIVNIDGVVISIVEGYPSYYTGRVTWWVSTNNTVAAAAELAKITTQWNADSTNSGGLWARCLPCTYPLDSYQVNTEQGTPSATPTPSATASTEGNSNTTKANLSGIEIELYSISQSDFQWTLDARAGSSRIVLYSNFSYTWSVKGPLGEVDSGKSGFNAISESTAGQIASFYIKNLLAGTSYTVSVVAKNAGVEYTSTRTITTKNLVTITTPDTKTATTQNDTKTATTQNDTKTATTQNDTKTATTQNDTKTATTQTATKTTTTTTQSETRTAAVAVVAAISNVESRTVTASNLLKTYTATEKESLLNVTLNSAKSAVVNVSTDIPNIKMVVTATKTGSKPIVFNIKTNSEGDGQIKTSKNLNGYTVTLSANGIKLDSDKAVKK